MLKKTFWKICVTTVAAIMMCVMVLSPFETASAKINFDLVGTGTSKPRVYNKITTGTPNTNTKQFKPLACHFCHTTGICDECEGSGELNPHITADIFRIKYGDCCIMCEGTGLCPACEGYGYYQ